MNFERENDKYLQRSDKAFKVPAVVNQQQLEINSNSELINNLMKY